jgi:regulator of nucleoside diphosphate kinase
MLLCNLVVSTADRQKLFKALELARSSWVTYAPYLDYFKTQLSRAEAVPADQVPDDVITMNSRFVLSDRPGDEGRAWVLVYPEHEAPHQGKISVLSPMGIVLLGARVGDEVSWQSSSGSETATVQRLLYQPEAAGHYDL